jgi:hypothetical protein
MDRPSSLQSIQCRTPYFIATATPSVQAQPHTRQPWRVESRHGGFHFFLVALSTRSGNSRSRVPCVRYIDRLTLLFYLLQNYRSNSTNFPPRKFVSHHCQQSPVEAIGLESAHLMATAGGEKWVHEDAKESVCVKIEEATTKFQGSGSEKTTDSDLT